jgi:hypothetical protein
MLMHMAARYRQFFEVSGVSPTAGRGAISLIEQKLLRNLTTVVK